MPGSNTGSNIDASNMDERRRQIKLQKERKSMVHKIKGLIKTLKDLMQNDENVSRVIRELESLSQLVGETTSIHQSVILLLPEEERENQNEWFAHILKSHKSFTEDVNQWIAEIDKSIINRPTSDLNQESNKPINDVPISGSASASQQHPTHVAAAAPSSADAFQDLNQEPELNEEGSVTQDDVKPSDSVSNSGSRGSKHSVGSKFSSSSSSACIKAEVEMAALISRQRLLKEKHALEEQEEQLRKRKENLALEMEIAASMAKVNVLRGSESGGSCITSAQSKSKSISMRKAHTPNVDADTFVPGAGKPISGQPELHLLDARPKRRDVTQDMQSQLDALRAIQTQPRLVETQLKHQSTLPGTFQHQSSQPGTLQHQSSQPGTLQHHSSQPGTLQHHSTQPGILQYQSRPTRPGTLKPSSYSQPAALQYQSTRLGTLQPSSHSQPAKLQYQSTQSAAL